MTGVSRFGEVTQREFKHLAHGTTRALWLIVGNEPTESDHKMTTKTPTSSYGQSASRYAVLQQLALCELREKCPCKSHQCPCMSCADNAQAAAWTQLTDDERAAEQARQRGDTSEILMPGWSKPVSA